MKKKAFTLAEVLISLAIVGIIAAITIPQIVSAIEHKKIGPTVGRAIEQFELGCQNLIQYYNEQEDQVKNNRFYTTLSEIPNLDFKLLASFIGAVPTTGTFNENDVKNYLAYDPLGFLMPASYALQSQVAGVQVFTGTGNKGNTGNTGNVVNHNYATGTSSNGYLENTPPVTSTDLGFTGTVGGASGAVSGGSGLGGYTGTSDPNAGFAIGASGSSSVTSGSGDFIQITSPTSAGATGGSIYTPNCPSGTTLTQTRDGSYTCVGSGISTGSKTSEPSSNPGSSISTEGETSEPSSYSPVEKEPESYDSFVQTYDYQGSGYDWTTGCPVDMNYVTLNVPTGYGYCGESWNSQVTVNTCVSDQDLKNLSQHPDYGGLCWAPSVITPSGCPEGQELYVDWNDNWGCYIPCAEGFEEGQDDSGRPYCTPIVAEEQKPEDNPEEDPEKEPEKEPDPQPYEPINSRLFRFNKVPTEIYFVGDINTSASAPNDKIVRVLIDYNGTHAKPNTLGRDIFEFDLLNNGKLRAYDDFTKEMIKNGFKLEK